MDGASDIGALSEKECEALRLLLAGHDAKSSARELGITHHAVNDRLRSARRKLGASSSREAALTLAAHEGVGPQRLVHEALGDAPREGNGENKPIAPPKRRHFPPSPGRWKGLVILMSIIIAAAAVAALVIPGNEEVARDGDTHPVEAVSPANAQSSAAALSFMAKMDAGDAEGTYAAAAPSLRRSFKFDLWELGVLMTRLEGGAAQRTLTKVERVAKPANPDHEALEILTFDTIRLDGDRRIERIVMARTGGAWKVAKIDVDDPEER